MRFWLPILLIFVFGASPLRAEETNAPTVTGDALPERYQTVIDRKPFGPEPPGFDPVAVPGAGGTSLNADPNGPLTAEERSVEEQRIAAAVRVSVLNVTPNKEVVVGFTDSSAQPPANYYMKVGETNNDWVVISADPAEQSVVLSKAGVSVTLALGEGTAGVDAAKKGGAAAMGTRRTLNGGFGRRSLSARPATAEATPAMASAAPSASALDRLRERRALKMAAAQDEAKRKAEAAERAEADRQQQQQALLQIQEELRRQREERAAAEQQKQQQEAQAPAPEEN